MGIVAGLVVVVGVVAGMGWTARRPPQLDVDLGPDTVVVRPRGAWRFWALRRQVAVAREAIEGVRTGVARGDAPIGLRAPGAHVPRLLTAGTYRSTSSGRSFWLVGRAREVTVIDSPGAAFDHLVLELSDEQNDRLTVALAPTASG